MNKYNCYNNMQTSRYAAIKYAQLMAYSNLETLFAALTNGKHGVLTSVGTRGLLPDDDTSLKVVATGEYEITIMPGIAITRDKYIAVNASPKTVNMEDKDNGVYNVYIDHATEYKMTGEETFYAGSNSGIIGTIEQDSCKITVTTETLDQVLLAKIVKSAALDMDNDMPVVIDMSDGDMIYPNVSVSTTEDISETIGFMELPYVVINKEHLIYNSNTSKYDRGQNDTISGVITYDKRNGVWSPIVDFRQTNVISIRDANEDNKIYDGRVSMVKDGMFAHIDMMYKKNKPQVPVIDSERSEIVWMNSHLISGYLTSDMVSAYDEISGTKNSIENTLAIINNLKSDRAAAGDLVSQERIDRELKKQQIALMDYKTRSSNLKSKLSMRAMDGLKNIDIREFAYAVSINEDNLSPDDDYPIMYEVEVDYGVIDAPKDNTSNTVKRWFYSRRRNVADIDWETMSRTYDDSIRSDNPYNIIYIPIRFGERIRYRVRAIGTTNMASDMTNYSTYRFSGYNRSQQYTMINDIYSFVNPDPFEEGIITKELVGLMQTIVSDYSNKDNRISALENQVSALQSEV